MFRVARARSQQLLDAERGRLAADRAFTEDNIAEVRAQLAEARALSTAEGTAAGGPTSDDQRPTTSGGGASEMTTDDESDRGFFSSPPSRETFLRSVRRGRESSAAADARFFLNGAGDIAVLAADLAQLQAQLERIDEGLQRIRDVEEAPTWTQIGEMVRTDDVAAVVAALRGRRHAQRIMAVLDPPSPPSPPPPPIEAGSLLFRERFQAYAVSGAKGNRDAVLRGR